MNFLCLPNGWRTPWWRSSSFLAQRPYSTGDLFDILGWSRPADKS